MFSLQIMGLMGQFVRIAVLVLTVFPVFAAGLALAADETVVAKVNGRMITEADVRLAEAEIQEDLQRYPPATRRRVVVEFLIQNELFAEAAAKANVSASTVFKERKHYWDRRSLREAFFETQIRKRVSDAEAKAFYDREVQKFPKGEQVRASHILLRTEEEAKAIFEQIAHDGDFAELARKHSIDGASRDRGGDLGYLASASLEAPVAKMVSSLPVGEVGLPVQSSQGWHVVKIVDKRTSEPPPFETIKERIVTQLMHDKARALAEALRANAQIEYLDPAAKQQ